MTQAEITIREAGPSDSAIILHHRRSMFRDMGEGTVEELDRMGGIAGPWLARALADGSYRGWLALDGSGRVVGGGVLLCPWPANPKDPCTQRAVILNVYTEPEFRKRGIARQIMLTILAWVKQQGLRSVNLHASKEGCSCDAKHMIRPDYKEFARLSRGTTLVPVAKSISADLLTPVSAFLAVAEGEPDAFLLESVEGGEKIGRYTFLGVRPFLRLESRGAEIKIERGRKVERRTGNVFEVIKELLQQQQPATMEGLPPFTAGAVGYCAYDIVRRLENIGEHAADDLDVPDCVLMFFDRVLAFDHLRHQIHIVASADVTREAPRVAYERAVKDIARIEKKLAAGWKPAYWRKAATKSKLAVRARTPKPKFLESVRRAKEYIAAGDIFQVVLSQRWDFEPGVAPLDLYRALRTVNPSPYMYFLRFRGGRKNAGRKDSGAMHVLGSSPEMLVRAGGRKLEYRPIAGTHPRGRDEAEDAALEKKMLADEKERAEHVMLVDLGRNDLGRVSEYGSVKVRDLMYVERYSHVMHLVSALEGRLRPELDAMDAFTACFPAGTLSGAPKVRAMQIIEELEPTRRGVYGGSVLYADFAGNLDSCIAIRTLLMKGKKAYLQAGAGIVADSDPQREFEETENKARAVLRAVEMARGSG